MTITDYRNFDLLITCAGWVVRLTAGRYAMMPLSSP